MKGRLPIGLQLRKQLSKLVNTLPHLKMYQLVVFMLLLAGCAKPPRVAITVRVWKTSATAGKLMLTVQNEEDRATTPILLEASVKPANGAPIRVAHPAPFVLNRKEAREIVAPFQSDAAALDAVVALREGETGKVLEPVSLKVLPATSPPPIPARAAPAIPPPPRR